ncbi:MAG: hypothetical protein V1755_02640 [Chloroflexota bacterium]
MAADVVKAVDGGLAITTNRLLGSGTEPKYLHWGTGTTAAANGDTALETPRNEARVDGTSSQETTNTTGDTYQVTGTLTAAGTAAAITELGLFDGAGTGTPPTGANLFLRGTFDVINLSVGNTLTPSVKTVYNQA